jgi:UPF0716 family protein affecting phage T7 exclusion
MTRVPARARPRHDARIRERVASRVRMCQGSWTVRLSLLFLVLLAPVADLLLLFVIAQFVGGWPVLGFVVASALLGGRLAQREGRRVLREFDDARRAGQAPREGLLSAGLLALAGVLLVLPGVVSSLAGLALLVPALRRLLGRIARRWFERHLIVVGEPGPHAGDAHEREPAGRPVIDVDERGGRVIDIDERGRPVD